MDDQPDIASIAAALIGLDLPPQCIPGVREALAALATHWRVVEPARDAAE